CLMPLRSRNSSKGSFRSRATGISRDLPQRTKPRRGGEDRELDKRSASATRPTDSYFAPRLYRCAVPCYPPAWRRGSDLGLLFTPRRASASPRLRPLPIDSISMWSKGRASRGFVLRGCIRKAGGARGEAALGHGLADTRFFRLRIPDPAPRA